MALTMKKDNILSYDVDGINMKGKDILTLNDLSQKEIYKILKTTHVVKNYLKANKPYKPLKDKTLGMIFHKSSTRTRVSFEVGIVQLGGYPLFLNKNDLQMNRGEAIADTARVLSRYLDGIMIRTYSHDDVEELAEFADIPIINGLTDFAHPCQVLADLYTAWEYKKKLKGIKMAFIGDGNNMANSLLFGCTKVGMDISIASPKDYQPESYVVAKALETASETGSKVTITDSPEEAAKNADILYTDVWASMGQEEEAEARKKAFANYQVNEELLKWAKNDAIVMHCLPAHRGEEITHEVLEGPQSVVFDEAENRLHAQKAIMSLIM